jgi:D-xylose transport system ATP-binding protein
VTSETTDDRSGSTPAPRLQMRGMRKSFGSVEALRGVDLEVRAGEIMALVGDNGAGKSTLVKTLSGAVLPDDGEIRIDGRPARIANPQDSVAAGVETVYQDLALCDNLDVVANLYLGRELRSPEHGLFARFVACKKMTFHARQILDDLSITLPSLGARVGSLSGGQRQAIAVGRAVLWGSRVVVLDEPTAALGVQQTATVYRLVRSLSERGVSVVLVSHNMVDVFRLADRITVLRLGQGAGVFDPRQSTPQDVIAAITGGNAVSPGGERQ